VAMRKCWSRICRTPVLVEKEGGKLALDFNRSRASGGYARLLGILACWCGAGVHSGVRAGVRQATEDAVVNANYIRKGLVGVFDLPYTKPSMHEVVFSDAIQKRTAWNTMDIAKRLIDYGFHPYTTAFPLIVPGAADDRADGVGVEGRTGFVCGGDEVDRERGGSYAGTCEDGAAYDAGGGDWMRWGRRGSNGAAVEGGAKRSEAAD